MPSLTEILEVFWSVIQKSHYQIFVVIDALDECSIMLRLDILEAIRSLIDAKIANLHLLVSSRCESDIMYTMHGTLAIRIQNQSRPDLLPYLTLQIKRSRSLSGRLSTEAAETVAQALLEKAGDL